MDNPNECCLPGCGCNPQASENVSEKKSEMPELKRTLSIELLVIDLSTCQRCVPTGNQLRKAIETLRPAAETLGIELQYQETIVRSADEAKRKALLTSPTIRINGRDIAQDVRESACESCSALTRDNTTVDCREWFYRGQLFPYAPLPMLVEAIMEAMLKIDDIPEVDPTPLDELPANLQRYFANKREEGCCCG